MWPRNDGIESDLLYELILDKYINEVNYELYLPKESSFPLKMKYVRNMI